MSLPSESDRFHAWASRQPSTKERLRAFWSKWFNMENPHVSVHHGDIDETTHPNNPANTRTEPLPWAGVRGTPAPASILTEAHALVHGQRQDAYGHPANDFSRTAALLNIVLAGKLKDELDASDVALMMICVKLSREVNKHGRDNLVDLCGYAETRQMVLDYFQKLQG